MHGFRSSRWRNPAWYYATLGFCLLGFSLWVPWLAASRTARIESRAELVARCLLEACPGADAPANNGEREHLLARFFMLAAARGAWVNDLELVEPPPEDALLCLRSKHYLFQLTESPPEVGQRFRAELTVPLEVTAWPVSAVGPGHCAFFYPENAERAYTRNLRRGYAGFDRRPPPGGNHRHPGPKSRRLGTYTSEAGERWVYY